MRGITVEMLKIYRPISNLDWMNYAIVRRKDMTFHHITKVEHGGREIINNGALLLPTPHQYLHLIECKEYRTYKALNEMFRIINAQRHEPTDEQREIIEILLQDFERKHEFDKNSKHRRILKPEYLKRGFNHCTW